MYDTKYPYTQGQYIEIFQKDAADTLDQTIQKQFLTNISPKDCFVKDTKPDNYTGYPASYVFKTIGFPVDENSDVLCLRRPTNAVPYTESDGVAYFLGDTKHPKMFLFVSIGQQGFQLKKIVRQCGGYDSIPQLKHKQRIYFSIR